MATFNKLNGFVELIYSPPPGSGARVTTVFLH